jgi:hypothetical protein
MRKMERIDDLKGIRVQQEQTRSDLFVLKLIISVVVVMSIVLFFMKRYDLAGGVTVILILSCLLYVVSSIEFRYWSLKEIILTRKGKRVM